MITFMVVYCSIVLFEDVQSAQGAFDDLGKLLLGGTAAAVVFALAFTFVRLRLQQNKPQTSDFISISARETTEEKVSS